MERVLLPPKTKSKQQRPNTNTTLHTGAIASKRARNLDCTKEETMKDHTPLNIDDDGNSNHNNNNSHVVSDEWLPMYHMTPNLYTLGSRLPSQIPYPQLKQQSYYNLFKSNDSVKKSMSVTDRNLVRSMYEIFEYGHNLKSDLYVSFFVHCQQYNIFFLCCICSFSCHQDQRPMTHYYFRLITHQTNDDDD